MVNDLQIIAMEPEEASTATERVAAMITKCVEEYGEEAVKEFVISAAAKVQEAHELLAKLQPAPYAQRRRIDTIADRAVGSVLDLLEATVRGYNQDDVKLTPEQQAELDAAIVVIGALFSEGRGFLKQRWPIQFGFTNLLLERAKQPELQSHIACLKLEHRLSFVATVHQRYGELMGFTMVELEGENALTKWHKAFNHYVIAVRFAHHENPELLAQLLEPYEKTAEEIRAKRRKK